MNYNNNLIKKNIYLEKLIELLKEYEEKKFDYVIPGSQIYMQDGKIGMTTRPEIFAPNDIMHGQLSEKMGIPANYYRKMQTEFAELLDLNVSKWMTQKGKDYLLRGYLNDGGVSVGRALLSDEFKPIDNLPVLFTVLQAINDSGMDIKVDTCDVSERRIYVRFINEEAIISAKEFLAKYRNPDNGDDDSRIAAGFILTNSEVGKGRLKVQDRVVMKVCDNGLIGLREDELSKVHVGAQLDQGAVEWSDETVRLNLETIKSQIKDYVINFSSKKYLQDTINIVTEKAMAELQYPVEATINACKDIGLNERDQQDILSLFTKSGDTSRGGIVHAMTFHAQQVDSDKRYDIERSAMKVLNGMEQYDVKTDVSKQLKLK